MICITDNKFDFLTQKTLENFIGTNISFALYRLPNKSIVNLVVSNNCQIIEDDYLDLENIKGFVFAPYEKNETTKTILIPPQVKFEFEKDQSNSLKIKQYWGNTEDLDKTSEIKKTNRKEEIAISFSTDFEKSVEGAKSEIENSSLKKVVLSRTKKVNLPKDFSLLDFFLKLETNYKNSFVSLVYTPESGVWMGATPETLVSLSKGNIFSTVSLAGTKSIDQNNIEKTISWTQKEIEEQAFVSRYIIECFKKIRLREYEEEGPKTVNVGNLYHLKTIFSVNLNEILFENLTSTMLHLLHPTSAVCGMPIELAKKFIHNHEKHNRKYYAGFLGILNMQELNENVDSDIISIYVNIRCMQIKELEATLYAGAGITQDSNPESEFQETENKFATLLRFL